MEKSESENYQVGRKISNGIFKLTLNPTIINKEVIPSEGPLVICGNHLHVWDQFPVMMSTNRTIHWMAKKEYFDGKMGPVFRYMECIPVDRTGNTKLSKDKAIEYLDAGSAVGIFPEGTRNGLKEKHLEHLYEFCKNDISYKDFKGNMKMNNDRLSQVQLLESLYTSGKISELEFKESLMDIKEKLNEYRNTGLITEEDYNDSKLLKMYSGAIKMAKATNAKIVTFGVTGNYKIGNDNLMIRFKEPIDVSSMSDEEANLLVRKEILTSVNENELAGKKYIKK